MNELIHFRRWPRALDWLLLVAWMALIFYFSTQSRPNVPGIEYDALRKGMHVGEYLVLFVLWWRALYHTPRTRARALPLALAATVVYAISDEAHQRFVEGRSGNALDVLIDSFVPTLVWWSMRVRRTKAPRPSAHPKREAGR